jgi:hypothetical protein
MSVCVRFYPLFFFFFPRFWDLIWKLEVERKGTTHVARQHNRRLLRRRQRNHLKVPAHVAQTIRNITNHLSRKSLISIRIRQAKRDGITRMRNDSPIPPIPAIWAAVQGVSAIGCSRCRVLVGKNIVRRPIDHKTAVLDAICIASWYAAEMRVLAVLFLSAPFPTTHPPHPLLMEIRKLTIE